jgi:hypothetical protein
MRLKAPPQVRIGSWRQLPIRLKRSSGFFGPMPLMQSPSDFSSLVR